MYLVIDICQKICYYVYTRTYNKDRGAFCNRQRARKPFPFEFFDRVHDAEVALQTVAMCTGPSVNSCRVVINSMMESYLLLFVIGLAMHGYIISQLQLVFNRFFSFIWRFIFYERTLL